MPKTIKTDALVVAFEEDGRPDGWPVILSHGFPYDTHAYDAVTPILVDAGAKVFRPYLRGFGPTRFVASTTPRVGQQAALGSDLLAFVDALELDRPILAGFDWGGLASCVAAALWPKRFGGLVSLASYDVIDIARQREPFGPQLERVVWYQHLFQTERGRRCLTDHRRELCRMLWEEWSPGWRFSDDTFALTAASFDNPDFVEVVVHAYRHDFGLSAGAEAYQLLEDRLAMKPKIVVPAVTLDGARDPLKRGGTADQATMFEGRHEHRTIHAGHNLPQEEPGAFADAVLTLRGWQA